MLTQALCFSPLSSSLLCSAFIHNPCDYAVSGSSRIKEKEDVEKGKR